MLQLPRYMKNPDPSFYVVLDANVWVAERLLRSSIGNARLLSLTSSRALLGLPEVIEMEVNLVVLQRATQAMPAVSQECEFPEAVVGAAQPQRNAYTPS